MDLRCKLGLHKFRVYADASIVSNRGIPLVDRCTRCGCRKPGVLKYILTQDRFLTAEIDAELMNCQRTTDNIAKIDAVMIPFDLLNMLIQARSAAVEYCVIMTNPKVISYIILVLNILLFSFWTVTYSTRVNKLMQTCPYIPPEEVKKITAGEYYDKVFSKSHWHDKPRRWLHELYPRGERIDGL